MSHEKERLFQSVTTNWPFYNCPEYDPAKGSCPPGCRHSLWSDFRPQPIYIAQWAVNLGAFLGGFLLAELFQLGLEAAGELLAESRQFHGLFDAPRQVQGHALVNLGLRGWGWPCSASLNRDRLSSYRPNPMRVQPFPKSTCIWPGFCAMTRSKTSSASWARPRSFRTKALNSRASRSSPTLARPLFIWNKHSSRRPFSASSLYSSTRGRGSYPSRRLIRPS